MKLTNQIFRFSLGFVMIYLMGSFIGWNFNAGEWSDFGRYMIGSTGVIVGMVFAIAGEM